MNTWSALLAARRRLSGLVLIVIVALATLSTSGCATADGAGFKDFNTHLKLIVCRHENSQWRDFLGLKPLPFMNDDDPIEHLNRCIADNDKLKDLYKCKKDNQGLRDKLKLPPSKINDDDPIEHMRKCQKELGILGKCDAAFEQCKKTQDVEACLEKAKVCAKDII